MTLPTPSKRTLLIAASMSLLLASLSVAAQAETARPCRANQLTLGVDNGQGRFDGMSHSGMVLTVTNRSDRTCALPTRPELVFQDGDHRRLPVTARAPVGMHPGPVLLPTVLPAHASATSEVRWVSGDVYDQGQCVAPAYVALRVAMHTVRAGFNGHLCGPQATGPSYSATFFKLAQ